VEQSKVLIKEGGVQLTLTIVDTPGFGDAVDNSNCWQPVINYIDSKCEDFLNAESRVNRRSMPDNRVHCCLYFIAPSGHGLKPLDIEFMKRLHDKVNVIPLIAKADTLTPEECQLFKKQIMKEIQEHKIKIYEFPDTEDDEDNKLIRKIKEKMPLAVVGSNVVIEVNGKKVRGRQYPWGVAEDPQITPPPPTTTLYKSYLVIQFGHMQIMVLIRAKSGPELPPLEETEGQWLAWEAKGRDNISFINVENGEHCDFTVLRNMLIRTHMQDLKDVTNNFHYENYRSKKLAAVTCNGVDTTKTKGQLTKSPLAQMEEERREHDSEAELERRHEQMKRNLEAQYKELEEKKRVFDDEKLHWEAQQRILEQQKLDASKTMEKNKKKGKIF
ncbi:Septin-7, partial [Dissostichus eleginoides]